MLSLIWSVYERYYRPKAELVYHIYTIYVLD